MNEPKKDQFSGTGPTKNRKETQPLNELIINCFYNSQLFPCSFTINQSKAMESHYQKEHYLKTQGVSRG